MRNAFNSYFADLYATAFAAWCYGGAPHGSNEEVSLYRRVKFTRLLARAAFRLAYGKGLA